MPAGEGEEEGGKAREPREERAKEGRCCRGIVAYTLKLLPQIEPRKTMKASISQMRPGIRSSIRPVKALLCQHGLPIYTVFELSPKYALEFVNSKCPAQPYLPRPSSP